MEAVTRMAQRVAGDVLTSAAAGDAVAFQRIIAEHHDDMGRVCEYFSRDRAIAEDATCAAWAIAWRKMGTIREPASLRPWLISVAVNEAK
jgi:RNA polymerase sigma-70 factor, ECF subfamily